MSQIIAFSGKGGTGKTTLAGLTIRYLMEKTGKAILAVDADSNSCLNEALGVLVHATIGGIRENALATIRTGQRPGGLSTEEIFDYQVQTSIVESRGFDLLVMGRPEGPGCYCAANNIIRKYTDKLADDYSYVVIDNEAGMEHLSRRTAHKVSIMFTVSDPTVKGIKTARRINELINELGLDIGNRQLIINRVRSTEGSALKEVAEADGLTVAGMVPDDGVIFSLDLNGKPVFDIPVESVSLQAVYSILDTVLA
ncbi:MAG: AAA family ATPase [Nitrospirae bacterium]|nr:AAA family ATPase [Nitrospirota bacterium]MBF0591573.1 AAA family ATPase [Nitrospirota bacterium]